MHLFGVMVELGQGRVAVLGGNVEDVVGDGIIADFNFNNVVSLQRESRRAAGLRRLHHLNVNVYGVLHPGVVLVRVREQVMHLILEALLTTCHTHTSQHTTKANNMDTRRV